MKVRLALAAVVLGAASCAGSGPSTQTVNVRIHFSRFEPSHFEFDAGTTVTFVVKNTDPIDHEFLIGDLARQMAHETGTEAHHGARAGEISIAAEETETTTYAFDEPGRLLIGCHLPTHWDYGMRGDIVVK